MNRPKDSAGKSDIVSGDIAAGKVGTTEFVDPALQDDLGRHFLAASPDCVKLISPDGNLCFMTEQACRLLEIDGVEQVRGARWSSLWPESERQAVEQAVARAITGDVVQFSGFCPTARSTPKWWDVVVSPVFDAGGKLVYLLAISRDVTAHRRAEQSLEISEQRFRALADNVAQFAWMADASGYIFWYNQRWFDYTGTTMAEMAGWGWKAVHHPEHLDRVVKKITACFESGTVWEDVFPLRGKDGAYRWFLSRAMPIRDETGRVQVWCGTNTDITEQRIVSQRLRQLARIIELSHEAMMAWDMDGGILMWNKGCEELYGFTKAEAVGAISHQLLKTRHPMSVPELERILAAEGSWTGEVLHIDKDGDEVWVDTRQECIPVGGRNVILETNRDITDRRKADQQRDLLVAELNHRVRNTLAIVQSIASQTARSAGDLDTFLASFTGRLQSLSSAHYLLTESQWSGAFIRRLIAAELEVTASPSHRIALLGDDIFLPPQAALQMTLILHELAVNAMQHGALSTPRGALDISWRMLESAPSRLQLVWKERDGPPVAPPVQRGFGTALIERSGRLPHLRTELKFPPDGLSASPPWRWPMGPVRRSISIRPDGPSRNLQTSASRDDRSRAPAGF